MLFSFEWYQVFPNDLLMKKYSPFLFSALLITGQSLTGAGTEQDAGIAAAIYSVAKKAPAVVHTKPVAKLLVPGSCAMIARIILPE